MSISEKLMEYVKCGIITPGEARVLELVLSGVGRKTIAKILYIQHGSVHAIVKRLKWRGVIKGSRYNIELVDLEELL